jgi:FlaA1/EpsC-like NDP-sugar epimerase
VSLGISEERAVWILWTLALFGGSIGILFRTADRRFAALGGGLAAVALVLVGGYLLHVRFQQLKAGGIDATGLYDRLLKLHARFPLLLFSLDGLLIALAYYGAYLIRWDAPQLAEELTYFQRSLPVILAVKLVVFGSLRIYSEDLRRYGLEEALRVLRANLLATVSVVAALLMLQRTGLSRGVIAVDFLLSAALLLSARFSFRIMENWVRRWSKVGVPAVLMGNTGEVAMALTELEDGRWPELRAVAVADQEAPRKKGRFRGYPLFGGPDALEKALAHSNADALILVEREGGKGQGPDIELKPSPSLQLSVHLKIQVYPLKDGVQLPDPDTE